MWLEYCYATLTRDSLPVWIVIVQSNWSLIFFPLGFLGFRIAQGMKWIIYFWVNLLMID
jgi:hypothetical protein